MLTSYLDALHICICVSKLQENGIQGFLAQNLSCPRSKGRTWSSLPLRFLACLRSPFIYFLLTLTEAFIQTDIHVLREQGRSVPGAIGG